MPKTNPALGEATKQQRAEIRVRPESEKRRRKRRSRVLEVNQLLPELVDMGERWRKANYYVSPHTHQHWEILYLAEGTLRIGLGEAEEILLKPGSLACVPPGLSHWGQYGPEPKHHMFLIELHLERADIRHPEWKLSQSLNRTHSAHALPHLERDFVQLIREATEPNIYQNSGLELALDTLVLDIIRSITEATEPLSQLDVHPAVSKVLNILQTRFKEHWTLARLAKEVGLSESRLVELFTHESACSIHNFLTYVRIRHAETLLTHSNLSVSQIGYECGFATVQHFSRVFRKVNGQAPSKVRATERRITVLSVDVKDRDSVA